MREKIEELRALVRQGHPGRTLLLAYALSRGMPYRRVELNTRYLPRPGGVADLAGVTYEEAQAWLAIPPAPGLLEAAAAARDSFLAAKARRRTAILSELAGASL